MPYRRSRRSFGRRRRYNRRRARPNASRAVVRGTFAPRHQYLKLKAAFSYVIAAEPSQVRPITLRIDNPYDPVGQSTGYTLYGNVVPLGWNAYANLFQRYVVHGLKVNARLFYTSTSNQVITTQTLANWAVQTDATSNTVGDELRSMPISGSVLVSSNRPAYMKRYFNMNRIMGVQVAKHDRFYWEWGDIAGHHAFLRMSPYSSTYDGLEVNFTLTWYISAVSSNAVAGDAAAIASLQGFTRPFTGGEAAEPDAQAVQEAVNTGFTTNSRALKSVGLGGHKRTLSK